MGNNPISTTAPVEAPDVAQNPALFRSRFDDVYHSPAPPPPEGFLDKSFPPGYRDMDLEYPSLVEDHIELCKEVHRLRHELEGFRSSL